MHILGITNGTLNGNSEILLKAALQAAQRSDPSLTVSCLHATSVSVPRHPKPLPGSQDISVGSISLEREDRSDDDIPDDRLSVLDAILNADALIIATPVYSHQPAGTLKAIIDLLLGPFTDAALARRVMEGKRAGDPRFTGLPDVDQRLLKPRVAGFIAVAGSTLSDQITMALPTMHTYIYSLHAKVVDQHVFMGYANPGAVAVLQDGRAIDRARLLGERVASQIGKSFDEALYLGERREGDCPYCHLSKVEIEYTRDNEVGCVTCGARGRLVVEQTGRIRVEWERDSEISCITMKGKVKHVDDIFVAGREEAKRKEEIEKAREEWKSVVIPAVPLTTTSTADRHKL